ncbi:MAG: putative colanic acid biosynthesis acetyltransferase WcaF [Desulforhopalus sp.]|jgi:putative colanic acid biosynthesis acetyltransferase WcaF
MLKPTLDINANRKAVKYSRHDMIRRILWGLIKPLFSYSPRPLFGWRNFLLKQFGAKVGRNVHIYNSATIYFPWHLEIGDHSAIGEHAYIYNLGPIIIGNKSTISQRAHLCAGTHDFADPALPLLKPPIHICDQAWICADAFVGPGTTVGEGAIIGARAVAMKDVEPWTIVAGNPAIFVKHRTMKIS